MNITTAIESEFEEVKWKAKRLGWNVSENSMTIYVVSEELKSKLEEEMIGFKYNFAIEVDPTIEETEDNGIFKSNIYIEPTEIMNTLKLQIWHEIEQVVKEYNNGTKYNLLLNDVANWFAAELKGRIEPLLDDAEYEQKY